MLLRCKYQFSSYMTATANLQTSTRAALAVASVDKPIAIRLGQQELDEVLQLARAEDRPAGNFARMVACRRVAATAADLSGAQHDERQHRPQHRLEPVTADLQALSL